MKDAETTILLVHNATLAARGLTDLLQEHGYSVFRVAPEAVKQSRHLPVFALLMTRVASGDATGFDVAHYIGNRIPDRPWLAWSSLDSASCAARAWLCGAAGFLPQHSSRDHVLNTVSQVISGEPMPADSPLSITAEWLRDTSPALSPYSQLTVQENLVLRHLVLGLENRLIAGGLQISVETVKQHVQSILRKTNASDRTQAAVTAYQHGVIPPETWVTGRRRRTSKSDLPAS